jgi:hypothetical protein
LAAVAVLLGFITLFILWRREYLRGRRERSDHPKIQLKSQDDAQQGKLVVWRTRSQIEIHVSQSLSWMNALT